MLTRVVVLGMLLGAGACGGAQSPGTAADTELLAPRRLYPLAEGTVWTYDVDTGEGVPTLAITRVLAADAHGAKVSSGGEPVTYEWREEGLYRPDREGWVLKAPIREGARWDAGGGATAEVAEVDVVTSTEAGDFRNCVAVVETGGRAGKHVRTLYCPDVGPVQVESSMQMAISGGQAGVRAELRGYALRGL